MTGDRCVGKSEVTRYLVERHGFVKVHPFDGGKAMCKAYYVYHGFDEETAERMVNGDLKDVPMEDLPYNQSSRYFMEELGKYLPTLGLGWTLGSEIERVSRRFSGACDIVIESLVYEEEVVRSYENSLIVRLTRKEAKIGTHSSRAVEQITPDMLIENNGTLPDLFDRFDEIVRIYR